MDKTQIPLVVDLDGTLIKTDLLVESFYTALRQDPFLFFSLPCWFMQGGKALLKARLAQHAPVEVQDLPYHSHFLSYLKEEHARGRVLILATASIKTYAESVASYLGLFQDVLATEGNCNLKGVSKLKKLVSKYGEKKFDYAGNGREDLPIFTHARKAILVGASSSTFKAAQKTADIDKIFPLEDKGSFKSYLKAIRLYQWVKNILLFIPLVTHHAWGEISSVISVFLGFVCFGLCASGGYIFNDLLDLASDRKHPRKKNRPFASGGLSVWTGTFLMLAFIFCGLLGAFWLNKEFFIWLLLYCGISFGYTLCLKTYVLIDVLILAGLYTLRILAGAVLAEAPLSFWLFSFSIFIFFSLALVKRCSELITLLKTNKEYAQGRDYGVSDIDYLREMGIASGYIAILIVALYINSQEVLILYKQPKILWLICPALFYWISRIWLKTGRGEMVDDPIIFSIKDKGSRLVVLILILVILAAL